MKINLITAEDYKILEKIQKDFKKLTYQNKGFEGLDRRNFTTEEKEAEAQINAILKKSIHGFSKFQNFILQPKTQEVRIRFQYNWNYGGGLPFTGVGYMFLDELKNGFRPE
jgi:hypothetical protein